MPKPKDSDSQAQVRALALENNSNLKSYNEKLLETLAILGLINTHNNDEQKTITTEMGSFLMEKFSLSQYLIARRHNLAYEEVTEEWLAQNRAEKTKKVQKDIADWEKKHGVKLKDERHIPYDEWKKKSDTRIAAIIKKAGLK